VKSLEINPDNTAALFTLVKIAYELNQFKDVEACLRRYGELHPNDYNMLYTLGGVLFKKGEFREVTQIMDRIIKTDPMDARAHALAKQARRAMDEESKISSGGSQA
jgi:predicted Zn-dependent protease